MNSGILKWLALITATLFVTLPIATCAVLATYTMIDSALCIYRPISYTRSGGMAAVVYGTNCGTGYTTSVQVAPEALERIIPMSVRPWAVRQVASQLGLREWTVLWDQDRTLLISANECGPLPTLEAAPHYAVVFRTPCQEIRLESPGARELP